MSGQPEVIWARLDNATLYADGSSPCVARTKEFSNGTKYVRADAIVMSDLDTRMRKGADEFAAIISGGLEWRRHDASTETTFTEFGQYMVEQVAGDNFRCWLPDGAKNTTIMVIGFASRNAARASCQSDLDGRRALESVEVLRRSEAEVATRYIANQAEIERLKAALEMIAGTRPCPDNLMGNVDIARAALSGSKE